MTRYHKRNNERIPFTAEEEVKRDAEEQAHEDGKFDKALRDLPSGKDTVSKCENATWPDKP